MMNDTDYRYNKKILLAVDTSENSRRAVSYVSQMIGGLEGFNVIFLHVINPPEEDYFPSPSEHDNWLQQYRLKIEALLEKYRQILIQDGFDPKALTIRIVLRYRPSIAECIWRNKIDWVAAPSWSGDRGYLEARKYCSAAYPANLSAMRKAVRCGLWNSFRKERIPSYLFSCFSQFLLFRFDKTCFLGANLEEKSIYAFGPDA